MLNICRCLIGKSLLRNSHSTSEKLSENITHRHIRLRAKTHFFVVVAVFRMQIAVHGACLIQTQIE